MPPAGSLLELPFVNLTTGAMFQQDQVIIKAPQGMEAGMLVDVPEDATIKLQVNSNQDTPEFGLCLRSSGNLESGYFLRFLPYEHKVFLNQQSISCVQGLENPFQLEIIMKGDIIDVCIDNRRCLVDRCPELKGDRIFFYCQDGNVAFEQVAVRGIL